jgi:hypothetical protein
LLVAAVLIVLRGGRSGMMARTPLVISGGALVAVFVLPFISSTVSEFMDTGSYTHRFGALESLSRLFEYREGVSVLIGDGAGSVPRLFFQGLLQNDGLQAVDNQVITSLVETGVIGLAILAVVLGVALRRATAGVTVALVVCLVQASVFDALVWPSSAFLIWAIVVRQRV